MATPTTPEGWKMVAEAFSAIDRRTLAEYNQRSNDLWRALWGTSLSKQDMIFPTITVLRCPRTGDMRQMVEDLGIEPDIYEKTVYLGYEPSFFRWCP